MIAAVVEIVKARIAPLSFVDTLAGLTRIVRRKIKTTDGTKVQTFPVGCDVTAVQCEAEDFMPLHPDNTKKTVIWFEDPQNEGATVVRDDKDRIYFRARPWMIVWINKKELGKTDCYISGDIMQAILKEVGFVNTQNEGNYLGFKAKPIREVKDQNFFTKYSWNEEITQYLMHPYDYMAIQFEITWHMHRNCVNEFTPDTPIDC